MSTGETPNRFWGRVWGLALSVAVAACAARAPSGTPVGRDLALETFDTAWRVIHETHFDTTFNGVDWIALGDELRPRAAVAPTVEELRAVIGEMLDRLGQSHFSLIPGEVADTLDPYAGDATPDATAADSPVGAGDSLESVPGDGPLESVGDLGLDVRVVGDHVLVTGVDSAGPAGQAGVRPGWIVRAVEGREVAPLIAAAREHHDGPIEADFRIWAAVSGRMAGTTGTTCRIEFLDAVDRPVTLSLVRRRDPSQPVKFGNLPTFFSRFASRRVEAGDGDVSVGVVWFNFWMVPLAARFDRAIDEFRGRDGLVLDLRGNRGGVAAMVMGVAGHFLDERIALGLFRTRTTTLRIVANPRRVDTQGQSVRPFDGPVAILVDGVTASASEVFAGGMQSLGRARVFGRRSAGAVLPAATHRLPNGDVLFHAFAEFVTATGERLEGHGVTPDEAVSPTREDLIAGRDPVLDAALRWIAEEHRRRAAGGVNHRPLEGFIR